MGLGAGYFTSQNKVLPGTYHNFISRDRAFSNLSSRGFAALALPLNWGADGSVITVTAEEFQTNSLNILGYAYNAPELKGLRDTFKGASTVYLYKLNGTGAVKATNTFADALYTGTRGNAVTIVIRANVDVPANFDVLTLVDGAQVDSQTVLNATRLVPNSFVTFKTAATLAVTAGTPLAGGTNGTAPTVTQHQAALDNFEGYGFNTLGCLSADPIIKSLYVAYQKRLREQVGQKFQLVVQGAVAPDYEGVINVLNTAIGTDEDAFGLVYWVTGRSAGVAINQSNTNIVYDGEYTVDMVVARTQRQLEVALTTGYYVFHRVGNTIRVLEDINSLTTFTVAKTNDFASNQVIRVIDQIAIDTAMIFNTRFLGRVPNDNDGRISFWNEIVKNRTELQNLRAIQDLNTSRIIVAQGTQRNSITLDEEITVTVAMAKLYATTVVA